MEQPVESCLGGLGGLLLRCLRALAGGRVQHAHIRTIGESILCCSVHSSHLHGFTGCVVRTCSKSGTYNIEVLMRVGLSQKLLGAPKPRHLICKPLFENQLFYDSTWQMRF